MQASLESQPYPPTLLYTSPSLSVLPHKKCNLPDSQILQLKKVGVISLPWSVAGWPETKEGWGKWSTCVCIDPQTKKLGESENCCHGVKGHWVPLPSLFGCLQIQSLFYNWCLPGLTLGQGAVVCWAHGDLTPHLHRDATFSLPPWFSLYFSALFCFSVLAPVLRCVSPTAWFLLLSCFSWLGFLLHSIFLRVVSTSPLLTGFLWLRLRPAFSIIPWSALLLCYPPL